MSKRFIDTFLIFFLFPLLVSAQKKDSVSHSERISFFSKDKFQTISLKVAGVINYGLSGEFGLIPTYGVDGPHGGPLLMQWGPGLGMEYDKVKGRNLWGPKLSFEAHFILIGAKLNVHYYTYDFNQGSFKISPEIGLTILGYAYFMIGSNIPISRDGLVNNNGTKFTFGINIPLSKYQNP